MKLFLAFFATTLFTCTGQAAKPFSNMTCKKTISDEVYLSTKGKTLSVKWVTRGGNDVVKVLRALADDKIPTSLLSAYGDMHIEFSLPTKACEFTAPGKFSCTYSPEDGKLIPLKVAAKVSPYDFDVEPDIYEGKLSKVAIQSKFSGKKDSRYLEFPIHFHVASPKQASVKAKTDFFFAHYWDSEGYNQNPGCKVDNVYLVD